MKQRLTVLMPLGCPNGIGNTRNSELMDSSTSRPWQSVLKELFAPRPHTVKIQGISEFCNRFITLESAQGLHFVCECEIVQWLWGKAMIVFAILVAGYDAELNSGSLSLSPSFWNWYK
jgi:hypothetical protein